jgi:hypothetical protein
MYLVKKLDYLNYKDWIEELFKYMIIALEMLSEFHHSNLEAPRNSDLQD